MLHQSIHIRVIVIGIRILEVWSHHVDIVIVGLDVRPNGNIIEQLGGNVIDIKVFQIGIIDDRNGVEVSDIPIEEWRRIIMVGEDSSKDGTSSWNQELLQ